MKIQKVFILVSIALLFNCASQQSLYKQVSKEKTVEGYKTFLGKYPTGEYSERIKKQLERLETFETKINDGCELVWESPTSIETYFDCNLIEFNKNVKNLSNWVDIYLDVRPFKVKDNSLILKSENELKIDDLPEKKEDDNSEEPPLLSDKTQIEHPFNKNEIIKQIPDGYEFHRELVYFNNRLYIQLKKGSIGYKSMGSYDGEKFRICGPPDFPTDIYSSYFKPEVKHGKLWVTYGTFMKVLAASIVVIHPDHSTTYEAHPFRGPDKLVSFEDISYFLCENGFHLYDPQKDTFQGYRIDGAFNLEQATVSRNNFGTWLIDDCALYHYKNGKNTNLSKDFNLKYKNEDDQYYRVPAKGKAGYGVRAILGEYMLQNSLIEDKNRKRLWFVRYIRYYNNIDILKAQKSIAFSYLEDGQWHNLLSFDQFKKGISHYHLDSNGIMWVKSDNKVYKIDI